MTQQIQGTCDLVLPPLTVHYIVWVAILFQAHPYIKSATALSDSITAHNNMLESGVVFVCIRSGLGFTPEKSIPKTALIWCITAFYHRYPWFYRFWEQNQAILRSRSLHCVKTFYKIFVLHDIHMILESLESDFKRALIDTKISQIACWEHIEPKNTIHCNDIVW